MTNPLAQDLARWAVGFRPAPDDLALADRSLLDTVAVAIAGRAEPVVAYGAALGEAGRWAVAAHALDFDDLHMESTAHVSAVCVPVSLAVGGGDRSYLAAAGVMARLGAGLGWDHYAAGWHATTTSGALAAAVAAAVALDLDADGIARAMALAVPAAGGVQRAFGTDSKPLQVGFAADGGVRAARLAAAGARADPSAVDAWFDVVGGKRERIPREDVAVPGGLAIKIYPCCYAMQRPIHAIASIAGDLDAREVRRIRLRTPASTVQPLIHARPSTAQQSKFSLEYAAAAAILDGAPGFDAFTDDGVRRRDAVALMERVDLVLDPGGDGLLEGELDVQLELVDGRIRHAREALPPGSPTRPPTSAELRQKVDACLGGLAPTDEITWESAGGLLRRLISAGDVADRSVS